MTLPNNGKLIRICVSNGDQYDGLPIYEWVVRKAREDVLVGQLCSAASNNSAITIINPKPLRLSYPGKITGPEFLRSKNAGLE